MQPTTELDVAAGIASGALPSPTTFLGTSYFAIRISGTGVAYRPAKREYGWRDPKIWLGAEMQRRVLGVPVVLGHPEGTLVKAEYLAQRIAGIITYAFVRGTELWGVMRALGLHPEEAALLVKGDYDTSPGIILAGGDITTEIQKGERLLNEGLPKLVDHVAICARGVWSKGGTTARGVEITEKELST